MKHRKKSDIDSDVITARSLLSRLENAETLSIFTRQPEQETARSYELLFMWQSAWSSRSLGEYHNNLTLGRSD